MQCLPSACMFLAPFHHLMPFPPSFHLASSLGTAMLPGCSAHPPWTASDNQSHQTPPQKAFVSSPLWLLPCLDPCIHRDPVVGSTVLAQTHSPCCLCDPNSTWSSVPLNDSSALSRCCKSPGFFFLLAKPLVLNAPWKCRCSKSSITGLFTGQGNLLVDDQGPSLPV